MERSSLSLSANITALACSAALPTMGRTMTAMNATGMLAATAASSMVSTT